MGQKPSSDDDDLVSAGKVINCLKNNQFLNLYVDRKVPLKNPMRDLFIWSVIDQFEWVRMVYAVTFIMYFIRILLNFYVSPNFGPKVDMIYNMIQDFCFFLVIFSVFLFSYGIAAHLLHQKPALVPPLILACHIYRLVYYICYRRKAENKHDLKLVPNDYVLETTNEYGEKEVKQATGNNLSTLLDKLEKVGKARVCKSKKESKK